MQTSLSDSIHKVLWLLVFLAFGWMQGSLYMQDKIVEAVGEDVNSLQRVKDDCEDNLPRNVRCIAYVEFLPEALPE